MRTCGRMELPQKPVPPRPTRKAYSSIMQRTIAGRITLLVAIALALQFFPARLSAQQKYIGVSLCSDQLKSPRSRFGIRLDGSQHAYIEYREIPTARVVMLNRTIEKPGHYLTLGFLLRALYRFDSLLPAS